MTDHRKERNICLINWDINIDIFRHHFAIDSTCSSDKLDSVTFRTK